MKQNLITDVIQGVLPYLNNAQSKRLQEVLKNSLMHYEVTENANIEENDNLSPHHGWECAEKVGCGSNEETSQAFSSLWTT